ncbi:MAG: hypothetical protein HY331_10110 [Chloroflexi bacterium]|nr:hypothetical protein [Chloroflexota bacterium]
MATKIGEVVEASTAEFVAQSYELHEAPEFGSLVRATGGAFDVYGLTVRVTTASIEPGRRPIARGRDEATLADVFRNNPQIPRLLRTEFVALVVGFQANGGVCQYLPPHPPPVHGFVHPCEPAEVVAFTGRLDFLSLLMQARGPSQPDELIAAFLRQVHRARGDRSFLVAAGKEIALLLGGDVGRLNGILRRIRP